LLFFAVETDGTGSLPDSPGPALSWAILDAPFLTRQCIFLTASRLDYFVAARDR
jgi:hypothetical protein